MLKGLTTGVSGQGGGGEYKIAGGQGVRGLSGQSIRNIIHVTTEIIQSSDGETDSVELASSQNEGE